MPFEPIRSFSHPTNDCLLSKSPLTFMVSGKHSVDCSQTVIPEGLRMCTGYGFTATVGSAGTSTPKLRFFQSFLSN